jgi:MoaA/NifB/PqqE/SkfB family radical SAM enzyme
MAGEVSIQDNRKTRILLPLSLEWWLTRSCNSSCTYCSRDKPQYRRVDYKKTLDEVIRLGPKHIFIMGGEPSMVEALPEIVKQLKTNLNCHIGISTNMKLPGIIYDILPYVDDLVVSVDTLNKKISLRDRNVDPESILSALNDICSERSEKKYAVNISVNSVVYERALSDNGIECLNDAVYKINRDVWHLFCPLYPLDMEGSIIKNTELKNKFFEIIKSLENKNRKIRVNYPDFTREYSHGNVPVKCFRRYFRVKLVEDGVFFSPCPPADARTPLCDRPCATALFIDDLLYAGDKAKVNASQLKGKLDELEAEKLVDFIKTYINPEVKKSLYKELAAI